MLGPLPVEIQHQPKDLDIEETGSSYFENALLKGQAAAIRTKCLTIADDSGLEIDILGGDPGIYSARWAGKKGNFVKAMNKVFKVLYKKNKNWKNEKIKARFVCALTIYGPNWKTINSIGKIEGFISHSIKGKNGFGYDPIFIPKGKKITFGEMKSSQKYKIDHRFKAFKRIKKFF